MNLFNSHKLAQLVADFQERSRSQPLAQLLASPDSQVDPKPLRRIGAWRITQ
jgi:hypothetical protein